MQNLIRIFFLLALKALAKLTFSVDSRWLGDVPPRPWDDLKIIVFLNHTSLYEWLFAAAVPNHLLRRIATRGYIPVADITIQRPVFGRFLRLLAPNFLSITREPDHTWKAVLDRLDENSMVIIFPEGRMKRANGLDKHGNPMTVRGGVADLLGAVKKGKMLFAYSGGLHHVQVPGQNIPNLFQPIRMTLEFVDIETYRNSLATEDRTAFKQAVKADMESRRDRYCSPPPSTTDKPINQSARITNYRSTRRTD